MPETNPIFSVICVFNKPEVLRGQLLPSLKKQELEHELRLIDNSAQQFKSCAEALNHGARGANGRYLMFVHQDVALFSPSFLSDAASLLDQLPDLGIAGVAGMAEHGRGLFDRMRSAITVANEPPPSWLHSLTSPEVVQTLDELLLIVPARVFQKIQFDPVACPHWDLYGVEYSLSVADAGMRAFVLPLPVAHPSYGRVGSKYRTAVSRVLAKHRHHLTTIYTTCGIWRTGYPVGLQRVAAKLYSLFCRILKMQR